MKRFYLLATTVLGSLLVFSLFFLGKVESNSQSSTVLHYSVYYNVEAPKEKGFATETVPTGDVRIARKLNKLLKVHTFRMTGSYRLHIKAKKFFPIIEPILAKHGIPRDFKYIPLIESGLKGRVRSRKGAYGYWQLMPFTARSYGLMVGKHKDERLNIVRSTEAACKYIKHLKHKFGTWTLAAAAFNLGETALRKHISAQKMKNYYALKMNRETSEYLYKVLSVKEIIENPNLYGYQTAQLLTAEIPFSNFD